ncbi:hypothetical protein HYFRA_00003588 [Hymenoscyphus fraxineus]|uniref:Uncharacterized protein n=1 Tax=Hymenoscyphus fraxineus TaxID=746836 RepID=A0A9N9L0T5_9HELO|nr:hypothetical protein HYFRA_00003588 [Hymenoscyphus fraxineus]
MFQSPSLNHFLPLLIATSFTLGGLILLFNVCSAMSAFGLPSYLSESPEAQVVFRIYGARATTIGIAIFWLYGKGYFYAIDVLLAVSGIAAFLDGGICWSEGIVGTAVWRTLAGVVVGGWGFLGLTAREAPRKDIGG